MVVNKLMSGCGALSWYQHECDDLEVWPNGIGRWHWDVGNVRNELIRGVTGWCIFEERVAKKVKLMLRVVFEENRVSNIDRPCFIEIECKIKGWKESMGRCWF